MRTGRLWAIAGILALALFVAACGGGDDGDSEGSASNQDTSGGQAAGAAQPTAQTSEIKRGGTLVVALEQNPKTFDPRVYTDLFSGYVVNQVIETLAKYDENLQPQPWLAERIDVSPDGLTYTFALRQGVKFHDATEMDAEAVKFSVDRVRSFQTGPSYSDAQDIADTVVVDKYTFRLTLKEPNAAFMTELAGRIGAVVSPAAVKAKGDEAFGLSPVGTGPFTFGEFRQDNLVRVNKFDGYWRPGADGKALPYVDAVEFRIISEGSSRLTALQAGDVDVANTVDDAHMNTVKSDSSLVWSQEPNFSWSSFLLTVTKPPFDNKALRQAVAYAIDREEIVRAIYEGNRVVANGPIPPPHEWAIDPNYQAYPPKADLVKAKEKLAEGGMPNGFAFTYWNAAGSSVSQQLAELMQAQLAKAGITMNIETADFNGVVIPKAKAQEPGAFGISFSCGFDPDPCVDSRFRGGSSFNYMGYSNPRVNDLIDAARRTNNREERAKLYKEVVPLIMEDSPAILYVYGLGRYVGNKRVQGWSIANMPRLTQGYSEFWLAN
jgi:peptide/nickel transport system substrate-binding protein